MLYKQVMDDPYKADPYFNFSELMTLLEKFIVEERYSANSKEMAEIMQIITSIFYFLANLTTTDRNDLYSTESRRVAIIHLLTPNEKEFPFKAIKASPLFRYIP